MERLHIPITGDASNFRSALQSARDGVRQTAKQIEDSGMTIEQVFNRIRNAAAMSLAGFSVKEFASKVMEVRGEFQKLEVAFNTMLGSAEKADALMQQLVRTAAITPFDLKGVADGAKQLMAYGIAADEVNDTLIHLGDIAAGLSLPLGDLVYLYGTTMTQGRMFTQDLRQFMGRGIPLAEELAKQFGVTKDKVGELVTAGKVGADEFKKAIMAMSSEGGRFGGLMEEQSKTITGQISNIEDAIDVMFNNIGKQSEGIINGALSAISSLVENYETVGRVIMGLVVTYGVYKTAVMTVTALESFRTKNLALQAVGVQGVTAAEAIHYHWLVLTQKAQALLNATMLANPYVAVAVAVAAVTAALISLGSEQDRVNAAYDEYMRKRDEAIAKEEEHRRKIEQLIQIAGDESLSTDTRRKALLKLEEKYPDIFKKYATETEMLKHIRDIKAEIAILDGKTSIANPVNELAEIDKRIAELQKKGAWSLSSTNSYAGTHSSSRTRSEEEELQQKLRRRRELAKEIERDRGETYLTNLTGVSNGSLQLQINERRKLLKEIEAQEKLVKKDVTVTGRVKLGGATGVYNKQEIQAQLQNLEREQERRAQIVKDGSKDFVAEANKAYAEQKVALQQLEALHDPLKRVASDMTIDGKKVKDMGSDEFLAAIEKQQKAVDEAKKKVDAYNKARNGGSASTSKQDSAAKEDADQQAKSIQQQLKYNDEIQKLQDEAAEARSKAEVAAIRNDAERERKEREYQHRKTIEDIAAQQDEIYKKIYKDRKAAYENANKGKHYETETDEGKNGWMNIKRQTNAEVTTVTDALGKEHTVIVTPVLPSGKTLTEQELSDYIKNTLEGATDIANADVNKIVIGIDVDAKTQEAVKALDSLQNRLDTITPDQLEDVQKAIDNLDLSGIFKDDKEIEEWKAKFSSVFAQTAERNANFQRDEQKRYEDLVKQYQSYTDQRLEIEKRYREDIAKINAAIADAKANGDTESVEKLTRSLAEASKKQMKELSDVAMNELQDSPLFSLAWKDLGAVSTETLNMLIAKFKEFEGQFASDPQAMKEWSERIKAMSDEVVMRNPFKAMAKSRQELEDAIQRKSNLTEEMNRLVAVIKDLEREKTGSGTLWTSEQEKELTNKREQLKKVTNDLGQAEQDIVDSTTKQNKAWQESKRQADELASAISSIGNAVGGASGEIIKAIGDVMNFTTTAVDGIKAVSQTGAAALSAIEKASVILGIISAAIQLMQTISSFHKDAHDQYEEYASRINDMEKLRQATYNYRMELIKARQEERKWFSTTGFQDLRDQWEQSAAAMAEYAGTISAAQAIYENEDGGGWLTDSISWLVETVGDIVSIPGKIVSGVLDKIGIADKDTLLGKAIEWITTADFAGGSGVLGKLTGELLKAKEYAEGTTAAINNLRVETRAASSGFWGTGIGGHSQRTQDLQSYVNEKYGRELFDENGVLTSVEFAQEIMEKEADRMVGQTKETMERIIELKQQYDEWQQQLKEFISELYSPLADDMVDALWEWYENGTDIMDAFKAYSADTFKSIGKEMVKQLVNTLLFDELKDKMQALLTAYSIDASAGQKSEAELTEELMKGTQAIVGQMLVKAEKVAPILQEAVTTWQEGMEQMGLTTQDSFSSAFNSIKESFKSMLTDMDGNTEDFAKNVRKTIYEYLVDKLFQSKEVTDKLNEFYQRMDDATNGVKKDVSGNVITDSMVLNAQISLNAAEESYMGQLSAAKDEIEKKIKEIKDKVASEGRTELTDEEFLNLTELENAWNSIVDAINEGTGLLYTGGRGFKYNFTEAYNAVQEAKKRIDEINAAIDLTDEEKSELVEGVTNDLEEYIKSLEADVKRIGDMVGWTMEQEIDSSALANLGDDLLSVLQDTSKSVDDWKKEIVKKMTDELVKEVVYNEDYKKKMREFQEEYVNILSDDSLDEEGKANALNTLAEDMAQFATETSKAADDVNALMGNMDALESSFGDLHDSFMDSIFDMENGAESFAKKMRETLVKDLVEKTVFNVPLTVTIDGEDRAFDDFDKYQDDWNKRYLAIYNNAELSAEERERLLQQLVDELIAQQKITAEAAKDLVSKLSQDTTFNDMASSFKSALMDMDATADDWGQEIGKTLANRIIEQMIVPTMVQPLLQTVQDAFDAASLAARTTDENGSTLYDWKALLGDENLKNAIADMQGKYPQLKEIIQNIMSLAGLKPETSNALDSLGDALIDRLLSLDDDVEEIGKQIGQTLIREMLQQMLATGGYADQIAKFKEIWQNILTSDGGQWTDENGMVWTLETLLAGIAKLEDDIAKDASFSTLIDKAKEFGSAAKEGFSDLRGAFVSALLDMNGDAESFGKQIGRTMLEQMLDAYIDNKWKDEIKALNQEWAEALESGNTEAIEHIKQKVKQLYEAIGNNVEVIDIAAAIKELDKQLDTTFSDMADSWASALMDMEGTAEDWAQSVGKMIAEKIIKSMVIPTMIQPLLNDMQKAWNAAAEQEGATYQTMLDAMMPYLSDLVGAYEELRPIADYILNSLGVYKEVVEELKEEVEYALQDMKDNFVSDLMDMEATAEKRAESISRIIAENFIKNFVLGDVFDAQMEQWQQHYESIIHSGLSEDERARQLKLLRDAIASAKDGYVEQALAIQELLGLNANSSNQTATTNMADKTTYEQTDLLLGVNMAQEMTLEQILAVISGGVSINGGAVAYSPVNTTLASNGDNTARQIEATLRELNSANLPDSETIKEIRGLIIISNSYLFDIRESNAQILRQFGDRLESIDSRLAGIF